MFTYSHANTPLGQSERAYYLSYFIIVNNMACNSGGMLAICCSVSFGKLFSGFGFGWGLGLGRPAAANWANVGILWFSSWFSYTFSTLIIK